MPDNLGQMGGNKRPQGYRLDAGGVVAENGPFIGEVMNNIDPTHSGRLQVYIESFGNIDKKDSAGWRTVSYMTPFYGETQHSGTTEGTGTSPGNSHTYGMWFTPPDIGVKVMCFFINGDPSYGYYIGCIPTPGMNNMIPAIANNKTEVNNQSQEIFEDPKFYEQEKPVHSSVQATMHQQGLEDDNIRGPIASSAQRESPSNVFGVSTPGRPVYAGGYDDGTIKPQLESGELTGDDVNVIGRRGGHTFVMDDGDISGNSQHIRIRTSKGHQITMSDDGDTFYITHANGK